jgi:hypothetical protein
MTISQFGERMSAYSRRDQVGPGNRIGIVAGYAVEDRIWVGPGDWEWDRISKTRKLAALLAVVGIPMVVVLCRGICWESLLAFMIVLPLVLTLVRLPVTTWLRVVVSAWALAALALVGWSGLQFHTLNVFSKSPPRITWCGRPYIFDGSFAPGAAVAEIGVTPSGESILGRGCSEGQGPIWIKTGEHSYRSYSLSA